MRCAARGASLLALVVAAALSGAGFRAWAAEEEEEAKITFSPEAENKLSEFLDKTKEAKRDIWEVRMRREIEDLEKAAPLGADGRKALDAAAAKAIQICLDEWTALMAAAFREQYAGQGDQVLNFFEQLLGQAETYAKTDSWFASEGVPPDEHPVWTGALRQTLPAEQMAAAENVRAERKQAIGREIAGFLKATAEMAREQDGSVFTMWVDEIKGWLPIPKRQDTEDPVF